MTHDAENGRAVAVEDDGGRKNFTQLEIVKGYGGGAGENGKGDFLVLEEARNFGLRLGVIERNGEERNVLICVIGGEFGQHGCFFAARETPGGPEIEDHDFAAVVGERVWFAGEVVERESRYGGRLRAGRKTTCEKGRGEREHCEAA